MVLHSNKRKTAYPHVRVLGEMAKATIDVRPLSCKYNAAHRWRYRKNG
jgi:hypothetical protein